MKKIYMQPTTELVKTDLKLMQATSVGITSEEGSADDSRKAKGVNYDETDNSDGDFSLWHSSLWDE